MGRSSDRPGYLPTLDGWRAVSIVFVILAHDRIHQFGYFSTRWIHDYGGFGVDVFFAISGILICSRLIDEERVSGQVSLSRFYARRLFRILPPALVYLTVLAALAKFSIIAVSKGGWFESLLFCRNYSSLFGRSAAANGWYTEHFWSLSLEEQFYFILPSILVLSARRFKLRLTILAGLSLAITINRTVILHSRLWEHIQFHTDVRVDALLIPALLAVFCSNSRAKACLEPLLTFWPYLVLFALAFIPFHTYTAWHITVISILMPMIVMGSVLHPCNIFGRILELRLLRSVGRISYSLYLWQQLFFTDRFFHGVNRVAWQKWPLSVLLTFLCSIISYQAIERPMARLGHRWAPSATPGREDLDSGTSTAPTTAHH